MKSINLHQTPDDEKKAEAELEKERTRYIDKQRVREQINGMVEKVEPHVQNALRRYDDKI